MRLGGGLQAAARGGLLLGESRQGQLELDGLVGRQGEDVDEDDFRLVLGRERHGPAEGLARLAGEIERHEDAADLGQGGGAAVGLGRALHFFHGEGGGGAGRRAERRGAGRGWEMAVQ
jgi:hypothetical protein